MEKYYSKVNKELLLHVVNRKKDISGRCDIIPSDNFIQCASLCLKKGKTFKPHKHIFKSRAYDKKIAQESWVVISGRVKFIFYDINDEMIGSSILEAGDASFTLRGGHNYEILEENTVVYEYKTGPYEGQEKDKEFINDSTN